MFTAKSLQLLDANNNNISPATSIETIYYEYKDGGLVKRNHIFKHFPVYVQHNTVAAVDFNGYNNNHFIFQPHPEDKSTLLLDIQQYNKDIKDHYNKKTVDFSTLTITTRVKNSVEKIDNLIENKDYYDFLDSPRLLEFYPNSSTDTFDIANATDIYVSAVRQKKFRNTDFKMLDISTYNLSEILNNYATNNWVRLSYETLSKKVSNSTIYHADIITHNDSSKDSSNITIKDVGSLLAGTKIISLDGEQYDTLFNKIFGLGYDPIYKPMVITATFPEVYYLQEDDLRIQPRDTSILWGKRNDDNFVNRKVLIENIQLNVKTLPTFSFEEISDAQHKKYGLNKQPKQILGCAWQYTYTNLSDIQKTSKRFYFEKVPKKLVNNEIVEKKVTRGQKARLVCNIKPDLSKLKQTINVKENCLQFKLADAPAMLKPEACDILDYKRLASKVIKSNFRLMFDGEQDCREFFLGKTIMSTEVYTKKTNCPPLLKTRTNLILRDSTQDIRTIKFGESEIMLAYPIYYGQTVSHKAMKCYWAIGQKLHKISAVINPGQAFYVAIPKIVINQLIDPIPHLYKILQQSKWQTAVDWIVDSISSVGEDDICKYFKFMTQKLGEVRQIVFTIDFSTSNIVQYFNK